MRKPVRVSKNKNREMKSAPHHTTRILFLQIKKVYDFVCGTTIRVISSISPLQTRKPPYPAEVTTAVARFI